MENIEEKKKKKWSLNKKLFLFGVLPLFIVLVSALTYYAFFEVTVTITQPINVDGDGIGGINCLSGETCVGGAMIIENSASEDRKVSILVESYNESITTGIVGEVLLSKKNETWSEVEGKAWVKYTIVGDKFNYLVESDDIALENYVLIYYPDIDTSKGWNINKAILIGDANNAWTTLNLGNLPIPEDYNANPLEGDSYCNLENGFDDYLHCSGAKFWLMEKEDWDTGTWDSVNTLFETDLITYTNSTIGATTVIVPAKGSINVYPQITVDAYVSNWTGIITTTVA